MISHRAKVWKSVVLARVYPVHSKMLYALRLLVESSLKKSEVALYLCEL